MPSGDPAALRKAKEDIFQRTLADVGDDFGRLICLASTRDYNTGQYHHAGLAAAFSDEVACQALAECHRDVFDSLLHAPMEELVQQLENYLRSTGASPVAVLESWSDLQPYRVVVPADCEKLSAELFFSNVKIAVAILRNRRARNSANPQSAWQPQSLGR
ncbi:MAG TPA: hypothetical protein VFO34_02615 [Candidatus Acidoferrales bacterium]|nr:hypothetical protein [Candidatus Acidoferrales bacterium]